MKISFRARIYKNVIKLLTANPHRAIRWGYYLTRKKARFKTPGGYELKTFKIDDLPVELLICPEAHNSKKIIIQFHGGSFLFRYFDLYRHIAYKYARISKAKVISIDYHTAPYHVFPDAHNDALKVWDYLINQGYQPQDIIVVGDSAGGNLVLFLAMKLRDDNRLLPKALVMFSPWTDLDNQGPSYQYNLHKDILFGLKPRNKKSLVEEMKHIIKIYANGVDLQNPYLSPAYGSFKDLPPMLIIVGTDELLESDAITVFNKARKENVDVTLSRYPGMFHDFPIFLNLMPESKKAWIEVSRFLNTHFQD